MEYCLERQCLKGSSTFASKAVRCGMARGAWRACGLTAGTQDGSRYPGCRDLQDVAVKCGCARGGLSSYLRYRLSHRWKERHFAISPFLGQPIQSVPNANPTFQASPAHRPPLTPPRALSLSSLPSKLRIYCHSSPPERIFQWRNLFLYRVLSASTDAISFRRPQLSKTWSLKLVRFCAKLTTLEPLAGKSSAHSLYGLRQR